MSGWREVPLGEICHRVTSGGTPKRSCPDYYATAGGGHNWVKSSELRDGYVRGTVERITEQGLNESAAQLLPAESVLVAMYGATAGRVGLLKIEAAVNQAVCALVADEDQVHPLYLFHLLRSMYSELAGKAAGAAQQNLNAGVIRSFRILAPKPTVQRRIAAVLGAFDELIEINERRIELLEWLARSLYREWFVRFRFPGHEHLDMEDSEIGPRPGDWEVRSLGEAARSFVDGDWIETKDQGGDDYRLIQVSNIGLGTFRETGNFRYISSETFDRLRCTQVCVGDILIARMPDPIGRAWLVDYLPERAITSVDVAILRPVSAASGIYLSQWLNSPATIARSQAVATGTTRKRVSRSVLAVFKVRVPSASLLARFEEVVSPLLKTRAEIANHVGKLVATRDLLLPRLVTGRLDISDIDLGALLPADAA